jgi:hypothetical protein
MSTPLSTVKRTPLNVHKAAAGVTTLNATILAGNNSPAVQGDPLTKQALATLATVVGALGTNVNGKANALATLGTSRKALTTQFTAVEVATRAYEQAVNLLSGGDPAIITAAGLLVRDTKTPTAALGAIKDFRSTLGKAAKEAVLHWPAVKGATSYAIQVNWTPATPTGPWTAIPSGSSRRRLIVAPTQGLQFLAQVAAISSDGTQSAWCDAILVTTR